jgi:hypothetical protein
MENKRNAFTEVNNSFLNPKRSLIDGIFLPVMQHRNKGNTPFIQFFFRKVVVFGSLLIVGRHPFKNSAYFFCGSDPPTLEILAFLNF